MTRRAHGTAFGVAAFVAIAAVAIVTIAAQPTQQQTPPPVPVPRPFPGATPPPAPPPATPKPTDPATTTPPAQTPTVPAPAPAATPSAGTFQLPAEVQAVKVPPSAEYLESFDAGKGQRYYLFGTNDAYADVVAYFKTQLRSGNRELFRTPGMYWFDLPGRVVDATFPPSVIVKDYTWGTLDGYLFVDGATSKRYKTVIQIVPPHAGR